MKRLALLLVTLSFNSFATDYIGYSAMNKFSVVNDQGVEVFKDDVSYIGTNGKVDLRSDRAIIRDGFNNLTVIDENGTKVVDHVYAIDYKVSKKLIATVAGLGNLTVFDQTGHVVTTDNRVKAVGVSNNLIAYRRETGNLLIVKDAQGKELFTEWNNVKAQVSDNFVISLNEYGYFSIYNKTGTRLFYKNNITAFDLSNNFATYTDQYGFTDVVDSEGKTVLSGFQIEGLKLLDTKITYTQNGQVQIIDKDNYQIFWNRIIPRLEVLDEVIGTLDNLNILRLYNTNGDLILSSSGTQNFMISAGLQGYQIYPKQFAIYNIEGDKVDEINTPDLIGRGLSKSIYAVKMQTANVLKAYNDKKVKIVDEMMVQNFWMTTTNPRLNWLAF